MKFLFKLLMKLVITLLILIVVFVGIPLFLLETKTTPPLADYQSNSNAFSDLNDELLGIMTDDNKDSISLSIKQEFINKAIQQILSKDNPKFQNPDYEGEPDYRYMMTFYNQVGFKGAWSKMTGNLIEIYVAADYYMGGNVYYQTAIKVDLIVTLELGNVYTLKIDKIKLGKLDLPLNVATGIVNFITETFQNKSLETLFSEAVPFGSFDQDTLTFTVDEAALSSYLYTIDPTFQALIKVIYNESLISFDFANEGFNININVGKFRKLTTDLTPVVYSPLTSEQEKTALMTTLATKAALNAITNPLDPYLDLTEVELNQILDFQLQDAVKFSFPIEFELNGSLQKFKFESTNLFIRMVNNQLSIHLLMRLEKENVVDVFEMQFNLFSTVSINSEGDMVLDIISSHMGEISLDQTILKAMFDTFDDTLIVGNQIIVKKETLNEMFLGLGLSFDQAYVLNGKLYMHYGV